MNCYISALGLGMEDAEPAGTMFVNLLQSLQSLFSSNGLDSIRESSVTRSQDGIANQSPRAQHDHPMCAYWDGKV